MTDDAGLKIKISADVKQALRSLTQLNDATAELEIEGVGNIAAVNEALKELRQAQQEVGDPKELGLVNRAIKDLGAEAKRLKTAGTEGFDEFGQKAESASKGVIGSANSMFGAIRKLAYILPGVGVAGIFGFLGSSLLSAAQAAGIFGDSNDKAALAEKRTAEEAKHLADVLFKLKDATEVSREASGSEEGNIARVQALAAAIQDTNKTYKERKNALDELRETNKAYFGDLTLEADSLKTLSSRVTEYSQALITEAIVKGQVEEISKISIELEKQVQTLNRLKDARERAQNAFDKAPQGPAISLGNGASTITQQDRLGQMLDNANKAYEKQKDAVLDLRTAVASYRGELDKAIGQEIQFKPLKDAPAQKEELKSIIPILEQIKRIYDEINKPSREPLFKQFADANDANAAKLIQAQISDAIRKGATDGAKDPAIKQAYDDLAKALAAKLSHLQNPNLASRIDFTLANPEDVDKARNKLDSLIEKEFGKKIDLKIPANIKAELESFDGGSFGISLHKAIEEAGKSLGNISAFTLPIRVQLEKGAISDQLNKQLGEVLSAKGLQKDLASAAASFGDSIGEAIASGKNPIVAAGKSILTALGQLIQDIGKNLIEYGIAKQFLDTVLSAGIALPGAVAIGLGIAAEAIGALVKGAGQSYHAFASGGIVTGPTLGLVGEAGPEVIFPLDRLNRFIKGTQGAGAQTVNVVGNISGNNIRLAMARTNKQQGLV